MSPSPRSDSADVLIVSSRSKGRTENGWRLPGDRQEIHSTLVKVTTTARFLGSDEGLTNGLELP